MIIVDECDARGWAESLFSFTWMLLRLDRRYAEDYSLTPEICVASHSPVKSVHRLLCSGLSLAQLLLVESCQIPIKSSASVDGLATTQYWTPAESGTLGSRTVAKSQHWPESGMSVVLFRPPSNTVPGNPPSSL